MHCTNITVVHILILYLSYQSESLCVQIPCSHVGHNHVITLNVLIVMYSHLTLVYKLAVERYHCVIIASLQQLKQKPCVSFVCRYVCLQTS